MALRNESSRSRQPRSESGSVRVIGGSLRGSKLAVPDLPGLRPTPDRVRETLFNWLAPVIAGARCLDLFAGTGALGIEALSRGAARVEFVESDVGLARALRDNLARLKQSEGVVRQSDARGVLENAPDIPFDIAFLDPPFAQDLWERSAALLESGGWLSPAALIYVESPATASLVMPPNWQCHRHKQAGAVRYALFSRSAKLSKSD